MTDAPDQWDKLLGDALRLVTAGVDPDLGSETVADALAALREQARAMKSLDYTEAGAKKKQVQCPECEATFTVEVIAPEVLAKTMAQTAKMIDETARLVQFVSGKADSRPDLGGAMDWLQVLTSEQLAQVQQWVAEQQRAAKATDSV